MGTGSSSFEKVYHPLAPATDRPAYEKLATVDPTLYRMLTGTLDPSAIEYYYQAHYQGGQTAEAAAARAAIRYGATLRGCYRLFAFAQGPPDYDLYQSQCLQMALTSSIAGSTSSAGAVGADLASDFICQRTQKLIQDHVLQALELSLAVALDGTSASDDRKNCFAMTYTKLQDKLAPASFLPLAEACVRAGREDAVALIIPEVQRTAEDRTFAAYARFLVGVAVELRCLTPAPIAQVGTTVGTGVAIGAAALEAPAPVPVKSPREQAARVLSRSLHFKLEDYLKADPRAESLQDSLAAWCVV